jgi:photosystem II stability/assembly factor-like uncharacterized protein
MNNAIILIKVSSRIVPAFLPIIEYHNLEGAFQIFIKHINHLKCGISTVNTDTSVMKKLLFIFGILFFGFIINPLQAQWALQTTGTTAHIYAISPVTNEVVFAAGSNGTFLKTTNGGASWDVKNLGTTLTFYGCHFINETTGWVVGAGGLLLKTTNGGENWTPQNSGTTSLLYKIAFVNENVGWFTGISSRIKKTANGGTSWDSQTAFSGEINAIKMLNENIGWVAGQGGQITKTTNGGSNWVSQSQSYSSWLTDISVIDENNAWMCGREQTIIKTTDGGTNWINKFPTGTYLQFNSIFFVNQDTGWAITSSEYLYKTTDGGDTWDGEILTNIGTSIRFVNDTTGWIAGYNGAIYKTENGGVNVGIEENIPKELLILFPNPASDFVTFSFQNYTDADFIINIYSITGKLIKSEKLNQNQRQINIQELNSGNYIFEVKTNDWTKKQLFLIQK